MKKNNYFSIISTYRTPLMGLAALMIYIFHQWEHQWVHVTYGHETLDFFFNFAQRIAFSGVDIFFFLSGIGLIYAIEKHSLLEFYVRRLERVYLPFLLSALVRAAVLGWGLIELARKILFIDFLFVSVNSILWFVPAIVFFYLFFPAFYRAFNYFKNTYVFMLFSFALWFLFAVGFSEFIRGDLYSVINRIPIFLLGVFFGWFIREKDCRFNALHLLGLICSFSVGLYLSYLTSYKGLFLLVPISNCFIPTFLLTLPTILFAAKVFSLFDKFLLGSYIVKAFSFFGKISLELYCMHEFLDDILRPRLSVSYEYCLAHGGRINLIIFLCVLAATVLLYYLCQFVLRLIHRCTGHS